MVNDQDLARAILDQGFRLVSDLVAQQDGDDLFTDELIADLLHSAVALFNDNKNILTHCFAPSHQMM